MADDELRVAVAGLGFMGATHLRAWQNVSGARVTTVISDNPRKLSGDLSDVGGNLDAGVTQFDFTELKRYPTAGDALADLEIDALDICLPTHLHASTGLAALQAGKHVFMEKPIARTSAEARRLVEEARHRNLTLMAGHVLRFFPEWQQLARHLSESPVKLASFRRNCARPSWSPWLADVALSGGAPLDLLIHDADFALHCFGTPQMVSAVGLGRAGVGNRLDVRPLHLFGGSAASITGGWHPAPDYPFSMEFTAVSTSGTLNWKQHRGTDVGRGSVGRSAPALR